MTPEEHAEWLMRNPDRAYELIQRGREKIKMLRQIRDQQAAEISRLREEAKAVNDHNDYLLAISDKTLAENARLAKLNADLSAGDVKEVCELREELERKEEEITRLTANRNSDMRKVIKCGELNTRLRTAIVEARRQVEVCQNVRHDYGGTEEMYLALVKLAATLDAALGEERASGG